MAAAFTALALPGVAYAQQLVEGFADITTLAGDGWTIQNNSEPLGTLAWFQGDGAAFAAQTGAANEYIAVNYNSGASTATLSDWLLTPVVSLSNGSTFSFWTRTGAGSLWPDRLQVRLSIEDVSTDCGTLSTEVGDFIYQQLDINATYAVGGYPEVWTQYVVTESGLPAGDQIGRIGFRYFVENGGPSGANSNYIGLDELVVDGAAPICGDNIVNGTDACDEGGWMSATCDRDCTLPVCGDGFVNPYAGESCDDGNIVAGDGCSDTCRAEILYDQLADWDVYAMYDQDFETVNDAFDSEGADDFAVPAGAVWAISTVLTSGFQFDAGSATSVDVSIHDNAGGLPGAVATSLAGGACQYNAVVPSEVEGSFTIALPSDCVLGEGTYWLRVQTNQDYGTDGEHGWMFQTSGTGAPAVWRNPGNGYGSGCTTWSAAATCYGGGMGPDLAFGLDGAIESCGDGTVQAYLSEECDNGANNSDTAADACRTTCVSASCGDGVADTGEECDEGASNSDTEPNACRALCVDPACGDGVVDTGEGCDDGASNSDTEPGACRLNCAPANCGDGVLDSDEECDNGTDNSDTTADACRTTCVEAACGDGAVDTGEACDNGTDNSDTAADACRTTCVEATCGDGAIDAGEDCDDGTDNSDTAANACRTTCVDPACGDGVTDTGEDCDDGNTTNGDGCASDCTDEGTGGSGTGGSGTGGSGTGNTGGTGTGGSGTGNTGNTGSTPSLDDTVADDSGCGCRVPGPARDGETPAWLALGLLGLAGLRRGRRRA